MFWIIFFAILIVVCASTGGKIVIGATVLALGFLLLSWITEIGLLVSLAKICAVVIVVVIVGSILVALFGD